MSGGHWDYSQYRIEENLREVGEDPQVVERFPTLARVLLNLSKSLSRIVHDVDWDISGDTMIKDDADFEKDALSELHNAIDSPMFDIGSREIRELIKADLAQHRKDTMFSPGFEDEWVRFGFPGVKGLDRMSDLEIILEYVAAVEPEREVPELLTTLRRLPGFAKIEAEYMKKVKGDRCR